MAQVANTYDFAVLGDIEPEGLLTATALVRKGFSVAVISSSALGELSPEDESEALSLPERFSNKRLTDLLFRAGFFRLEDSGLVPTSFSLQSVLPKHRLETDGSLDALEREFEREFPELRATTEKILENLKKHSEKALEKAAIDMLDLTKKNARLKNWLWLEISFQVRPIQDQASRDLIQLESIRTWLKQFQKESVRVFRIEKTMRSPYHLFLSDHARRWGVHFLESFEDFSLRPSWTGFRLTEKAHARYLLLNSIGAGRSLAKKTKKNDLFRERMQLWLYFDTFEVDLADVPEPLQEFCQIDYGKAVHDLPSQRLLITRRHPSKAKAEITLASWLPFEDSRVWISQIEKGRKDLEKFMPFLPKTVFGVIPSLLELTEMRGDCVKRGDYSRLEPFGLKPSSWQRALQFFGSPFKTFKAIAGMGRVAPMKLSRRIFPVVPHYFSERTRSASLKSCLDLLDRFDRESKTRRVAAARP